MSNIGDYPINATKADTIRERFLTRAAEMRPRVAALRDAGDNTTADLLDRQIESWERMAAKRYESMRLVGTI